jgi:hypothetical protein
MFKLSKNIGNSDRFLRLLIGASFLYIGFFLLTDFVRLLFVIFGTAFLVNGITGFCGIYYLLGISTCKVSKKTKK